MATVNLAIPSGGTAADILDADMLRGYVEITAVDEDVWVKFGADADVDDGDFILAGQTRAWLRKHRPEITARVSVVAATTGSRVIANYDQAD